MGNINIISLPKIIVKNLENQRKAVITVWKASHGLNHGMSVCLPQQQLKRKSWQPKKWRKNLSPNREGNVAESEKHSHN